MAPPPVGTGKADSLGNWSVSASALANGQHSISAKATDLAGNVSPGSAALTVTIDTVAPAAPGTPTLTAASDSGVLADNITNVTAPTLAGTAEAGATVTLREGATVLGSGKADAAGAWTIATSPLTNGKHAITATASDAAGNASLASAALSVTIDNAPPAAPGVSQVTATAIAGTAEANASVALFDGAAQIGIAAADAGGAWSLPLVLAPGSHTLTAKATDLAGNVGAASPALAAIIGTAGNDALVSGTGIDTHDRRRGQRHLHRQEQPRRGDRGRGRWHRHRQVERQLHPRSRDRDAGGDRHDRPGADRQRSSPTRSPARPATTR